ncbi:MAG: flavodoxin-dependent (E)-4-hydroxy-3-methylbut-2-enyl-diphosphate synthase, partial [Chloroflexota bacterium]
MPPIRRKPTRAVRVGSVQIGGGAPIAVQSMAATKTQDIEATARQVQLINAAGADIIRIACDSRKDVEALAEVRARTRDLNDGRGATLSVDLQENYRLSEIVAPHVDKIRYNPGHLHHHEKEKSIRDKVAYIADIAVKNDIALRVVAEA